MQNKGNTNIEHIIAKIDNDFNPDHSDWIPRVGAWCIQAMQMLDCLQTETKKIKLSVKDRIAYLPCNYNKEDITVYDECGTKLKESDEEQCDCTSPSTGEGTQVVKSITATTVDAIHNNEAVSVPDNLIAETINTKEWPGRYNVKEAYYVGNSRTCSRNFVVVGGNKLELNYDAKNITIEYQSVKTCHSDVYGCDVPVIPNNGLLIEALGYYCLYKMLCRGYRHPVFNLAASQYGTNPYYIWTQLKDEAKRSIINDGLDVDDASKLFRSNFFIQTFDSRR